MGFEDSCIPKSAVKGFFDNFRIFLDEFLIPFWIAASLDHFDWLAVIEVFLKMSEIDDDVEIIPTEDASYASAGNTGIEGLDMLIRPPVNVERVLTLTSE